MDDEREEGEILEEDDERSDMNEGSFEVLKGSGGSDAESGKTNCDGVDVNTNLVRFDLSLSIILNGLG